MLYLAVMWNVDPCNVYTFRIQGPMGKELGGGHPLSQKKSTLLYAIGQ